MNNFKNILKEWKSLEDTIIHKKKDLKKYTDKKKLYSDKIKKYISSNNLYKKTFKFTDNTRLTSKKSITYSSISLKFLKKTLDEYFTKNMSSNGLKHSERLFEFVKNRRTKNELLELKIKK